MKKMRQLKGGGGAEGGGGGEERRGEVRREREETLAVVGSGGCENVKRVGTNGTRVDRVAKTTGSQVIIKCNQYFTYFSRKLEGCFPWIPYKFPYGLLRSFSYDSRRRITRAHK